MIFCHHSEQLASLARSNTVRIVGKAGFFGSDRTSVSCLPEPVPPRGIGGTQPTSSFRFIYEAKLELDFVPCCGSLSAASRGRRRGLRRSRWVYSFRGVGVGEKKSLRSTIVRAGCRLRARWL